MSFTDEQLIAKHREIKTAKDAAEAAHKKQNAVFNSHLMVIEGLLNARIIALGPKKDGSDHSIRSDAGTAFRRLQTYVRVTDKEAHKKYVLESGDLSFIDWGEVTREGVEAFMEKYEGHAPPGVGVTKIHQLITRES